MMHLIMHHIIYIKICVSMFIRLDKHTCGVRGRPRDHKYDPVNTNTQMEGGGGGGGVN